ncbi:unnamed protein product [Caretta caretta]
MGPMITPTEPGSHMPQSASAPGLQPQEESNPFSHHDSQQIAPKRTAIHSPYPPHTPLGSSHTHTHTLSLSLLLIGSLTRTMPTNWPTIQSFLLNPKWIKEFSAWNYSPSM